MVTHKAFKQTNHEEQCLHTRQVEVDKSPWRVWTWGHTYDILLRCALQGGGILAWKDRR